MISSKKSLFVVIFLVISAVLVLVLKSSFAIPTDWYNDYTYTLDEDNKTITLTRYNGTASEVTIPSQATISSKKYSVIVSGGSANNSLFANNTDIKKVTFENGVKAGEKLNYLFNKCSNLEEVIFNNFDTSATTNMNGMFSGCSKLASIDLSSFNTSNVTIISRLFTNCSSLKKIDLSNFDTRKVTDMNRMFSGCSSLEELNISSFTSEKMESVYFAFFGATKLKKIYLGHFDFLYGKEEYNKDAYPFGRGTWRRLEDGKTYPIVDVIYESSTRDISGTYVHESNITEEMSVNYLPTFRVEPLSKIDEITFSNDNLFKVIDNIVYIVNLSGVTTADYVVPANVTMLFKGVVKDANRNSYNLRVKIDNIHLYGFNEGEIPSDLHHAMAGIGNGNFAVRSYNYGSDLQTVAYDNKPSKYDLLFQIVDDNGIVQEGSFVFSAQDLDVASTREVIEGSSTVNYDSELGWGTVYSEGINLLEGFDADTIKMHKYSTLRKAGNRIYGTHYDEGTEFSEFSVKANASGFKMAWTGEDCGTGVLRYYQPIFANFVKQSNNGNNLAGAKFSLYHGENLVESWTSTEEAHTVFLNAGSYTLKETEAPNNYLPSSDVSFYVDIDGRIIINDSAVDSVIVKNTGKPVRVIVKYIDENTNQELDSDTYEDKKYGDTFTSSPKNFDNYILIRRPESEEVTLNKDETVLTYYYVKVSGGVIEKHVNILDNTVLYNENHSGNVGDDYDISSKTFEGFDLVTDRLPNNSKGKMKEEAIEVIYYYKEKGKAVVKYVDKATNEEIAQSIIINGYVNDDYSSSPKNIDNYIFTDSTGDLSGKLTKDDKEIIYYYQRIVRVTTEVSGIGGSITGDEIVDYLGNSTEDNIVIEADENHYISKVTINGEEINIINDKKMILTNFLNMTENKHIIVEFASLVKDVPKSGTTTILTLIGIITLTVGIVFLYVFNKRKKINF